MRHAAMKHRFRLLALNLALLATCCAPVAADDLLGLYREAVLHDATYAAARADYTASLEALPQAKAQLLPTISLSASAIRNQLDNHAPVLGVPRRTEHDFTSENIGLSLNQPLYRRQLLAQLGQADAQVRFATARLEQARQDLTLRVALAYFDALLAQDNVQLAQEQKASISEQLRQAKRMYAAGVGTITDVNEAQARFDSTYAQEIEARNALEIRLRKLEEITQRYPGKLTPFGEQPQPTPPEPADVGHWIDSALANNPNVLSQLANLDVVGRELEKARGGHHPTVDLIASYDKSVDPGYTTLDTTNYNTRVGIQLQIPLYQGGYVNSRVRQMLAAEDKTRNELEASRRQATQLTREAYLDVVSGIARIKALEQALKSHQLALYSTRKGFQAGVRTNVDVLNEQQLMYTAKRDLYKARYEYAIARLKLKAAVGMLDEEEVALVNNWLSEPAATAPAL